MVHIAKVRKRDGTIVPFQPEKIKLAISKALTSVKRKESLAGKLADQAVKEAEKHFTKILPTVEDIQDIVEEVLIKNKLVDVAKSFILYREKHKELREFKTFLGVRDELKLTANAIRVLANRYLLRDDKGNITETPARLFRRVAKAVAQADQLYKKGAVKKTEDTFYQMLSSLEFLPNTPTLMNAGTQNQQLSACFVLPVGDSLEEIFDAVKWTALIHQTGGGTGFSFSKLRPAGDIVRSTKGVASGPVSFMNVFDMTTEVLKQGGKRRGANMGILHCTHPDILEFITVKSREETLRNFNISIAATDEFMEAVAKKKEYLLVNPRTNQKTKTLNATEVFDLIIANAWKTGDPGLVFIDEINRKNQTAQLGTIESTNPCGEQPLHPYESCNLGSINLTKMLKNGKLDWDKLKTTIHNSVHFLDNVIDVNKYPLPAIEQITKANRRIGLGVMGFAELLVNLGLPYDGTQALTFAEKLAKFINDEARKASNKLAEERGSFTNVEQSTWKTKVKMTRNATVTTIAPTGTISIIADATSGIEPLFAVSFVREVMEGTQLLEVNPSFERMARKRGFYTKSLMAKIAKTGRITGMKEVPKDIQRLFRTALEIKPEIHVRMQAAWQKHCDNAVSKTINLPENATPEDVKKAYLLAHKLKCKGITIYRYGSKKEQVLYIGKKPEEIITAKPEYAGGHVCLECMF
ncbi:adenosylcobalamin-dependent ribonucleoside-diphosphate reductase [Candidatus Woesearchaeota archaeon]|nr:adenosylcobalamin-dependent ribonucleoside-diphosphate reductase [Candidatus Woesearchaeota archaeon]